MFDNLFIAVGGIFISIYNFIFSFRLSKFKSEEKTQDNAIFALNDIINKKNEDSSFQRFREFFMNHYMSKKVISVLLLIASVLLVFLGPEIAGIFAVLVVMFYIFMFSYPQIKKQQSYSDLNQELPYALRHMGIELKSGKGLHDSLITVSNADYGSFSAELTRVLEEVRFGESLENALLEMSRRIDSEGLSRGVQQIVGTLRVGGNLANSLEVIADDISFDMRVKLKDYSQRLNAFILIYTFIAILGPVILLIMLMAASTVMGDIISSGVLMLIYVGLFPMIVMVMGVFIKKLEPRI